MRGDRALKQIEYSGIGNTNVEYEIDFSDVRDHEMVKRAVEIAVAGFHNILMIGNPGSGKTMIAKRIPTIFPPMSEEEILETSKVYSASGYPDRETPSLQISPSHSVDRLHHRWRYQPKTR